MNRHPSLPAAMPANTAPGKPTLLVVDDTPENLAVLGALLKDRYRVKVANSGEKGLQIARGQPTPDLILLDIMMPGMDGYEVLQQLKADAVTREVPVIFVTAKSDIDDERRGLQMGAVDYITKPVSPPIVLARVATHLRLKAAADFLRDQNHYLESEVTRRTEEVRAVQDVTVLALASLAEFRDNDTGHHIRRTQHYVRLLCESLRHHPRFAALLDSERTIELLFKSAALHDIGKVGIPDQILLKPGKLTEAEFEVIKTHTTLGRDALQRAEDELGVEVSFLRFAKEMAYSHQEKWDGSGYPLGLAGEAIPASARLMAVADVYDALICRRSYKKPHTHAEAAATIAAGRGQHFDPDVVDTFLQQQERFRAIAEHFADSGQDLDGVSRLKALVASAQPDASSSSSSSSFK